MHSLSKIYVGIDISKNYLDIHILPTNKRLRVDNSKHKIKDFLKQFSPQDVEQVVFESTGGYECHLLAELNSQNYKSWQVDPKRIRAFIISEGIRAKTDRIDAYMIALFALKKQQAYVPIKLSETEQQLRAITQRRSDLIAFINMEENRFNHPQQVYAKEFIKSHIAFIKKQLVKVEAKIKLLLEKDADIAQKVKICKSIPGVGDVVASTLIAEMPELGKITNKQIASLLGVAPFIQQSGLSRGIATIKGGRSYPRKVIYMSALVASQCNPILKEFYNRLRSSGKKSKVALVAVMRKLIIMLNTMLSKGELWCPKIS